MKSTFKGEKMQQCNFLNHRARGNTKTIEKHEYNSKLHNNYLSNNDVHNNEIKQNHMYISKPMYRLKDSV
jgi:hypothetical protein